MLAVTAFIEYLDDIEIGVCRSVNQLGRFSPVRRFFALVSRLGDGYFWGAMGVVLFALQGPPALPAIAVMLLTFGVGLTTYRYLKSRLVRERPYVSNRDILCGTAPLDRYSFPSGHTLHAVCFSITLPHVEPMLALLCVPFAALVAVSRVVLGLHYPTDVLIGAAIGAALAGLALPFL